jgi:CysZ protein
MLQGFANGVSDYTRAFALISKLRLWGYLLLPSLISLLIGAGVLGAAWFFSDTLGNTLTGWYHWERGQRLVEGIATTLSGLLIIAFSMIIYKYLIIIILGPFMDPLSQKVEEHLRGERLPSNGLKRNLAAFWRGLRVSLRMFLRETFFVLLLLVLGLVPVVGLVSSVLIYIVQSYYAGMGNLDYTLGRHFSLGQSVAFTRQHRAYAIGTGAVYMALLLVPLVGLLLAPPLGTVAATIGCVERMGSAPK